MQKFHIVFRYAGEFTTTGVVIEAADIVSAISDFYERHKSTDKIDAIPVSILSINTQELVDLMASSRG